MTALTDALAALAPPVAVGAVFWIAMRAIVRADGAERAAMARLAEQERRESRPE